MDIMGFPYKQSHEPLDLRVVAGRCIGSILLTFGYGKSDYLFVGDYKDDVGDSLFQDYDVVETAPIHYGNNKEYSAILDQFPKIDGEVVAEIGLLAVHIEKKKVRLRPRELQQIVFQLETHRNGAEVFVGDYETLTRLESEDDLYKMCLFLDNLNRCAWEQNVSDRNSTVYATPSSGISQWADATVSDDDW